MKVASFGVRRIAFLALAPRAIAMEKPLLLRPEFGAMLERLPFPRQR